MGDVEYIPAVGGIVSPDAAKQRYDETGHSMNWAWDTDYFRHDWRLTSPMEVWRSSPNQPLPNARERLRVPKTQKVACDSGGFMQLQGRFGGSALEVSEFYDNSLVRGDLCFILDRPPFRRAIDAAGHFDVTPMDDVDAEEALRWTSRNARLMVERRKGDYDLAMICHGRTPTEMIRWYRVINKEGRFEAMSFAPKHDFRAQLMAGVMAVEFGENRPIHILGLSGARALAYSAYVSNFIKGRITHDSSAPMIHAQRHTFLIPGQLNGTKFTPENPWPDIPDDCPVCMQNGPEQFSEASSEGLSVRLLNLHNLYQILRFVKGVNAAKRDRAQLLALAPRETSVMFDAFDYYREKGLDKFLQHMSKIEAEARAKFKSVSVLGQMTLAQFEQGHTEICEVCCKGLGVVDYPVDRTTVPLCVTCAQRIEKRDRLLGFVPTGVAAA